MFLSGAREPNVSESERRLRGFLERPGVRDILASRVREAKVMEDREAAERRARIDRVVPHVPSVVR